MDNLTERTIKWLSENKFSEAVNEFADPKNELELKKYCWDLIPVLFKNVSKETINENKSLNCCCENLLETIAKKAEPEEVVLEFLDQLENADSTKFCFTIKLLIIALQRCSQNRHRFLESCLVSVRFFLEDFITSPSDFISEEEYEEALCKELSEIIVVLRSVIEFYEIFIIIVLDKTPGYDSNEMTDIFLSRLIQLYDFFLPCRSGNHIKPLDELEGKVMLLIKSLIQDPFYFLQFLMSRSIRGQNTITKPKRTYDENVDLRNVCEDVDLSSPVESLVVYENGSVISDLAYAVFFYSVFYNENENFKMKIPMVYNPKFIFLSLAHLSNSFFEKSFNTYIVKGLKFLERLLKFLNGMLLERYELFFKFHEEILVHLNTIMVYSQVEDTRKIALNSFKKYIESFDYEARYLILYNIRPKIEHSGTLGFIITLLKEYVLDVLKNNRLKLHSKYYTGVNLFEIISKYCFLSNGESTDLVQNADQIISALNMLRFILIRDKENITGINHFTDRINNNFLKPLKNCIESSREFYQIKLHEFGKEPIKADNNIELTINGQPLAQMSNEEQKNALFASLNAIDLIDSLLQRVFECM